jgi:hypothetical protein
MMMIFVTRSEGLSYMWRKSNLSLDDFVDKYPMTITDNMLECVECELPFAKGLQYSEMGDPDGEYQYICSWECDHKFQLRENPYYVLPKEKNTRI